MNASFYFHVFSQLVKADLISLKENLLDKIINVSIWASLNLLIFAYIMPEFGLKLDFGVFQYASIIASVSLFEIFPSAAKLINDFESEKSFLYNFTLPVPSWIIVLSKITFYSINAITMSLCVIPLGKIVLLNKLSFFNIAFFKLALLILCSAFFYSSLVIWIASIIDDVSKLGNAWLRVIFPMWFLGGFQFSWSAMEKVVPYVAYFNLLNPMVYITEGARASIIGQGGYLNFWICILMILFFSGLSIVCGFFKLKKRLDFI